MRTTRTCSFPVMALLVMPLCLSSPSQAGTPNAVLAPHATNLVALQEKTLAPFKPDTFLQAPFTVLYFSAKWCPDCRLFSPKLVTAYNQQKTGTARFEVLLLSRDKSAREMQDYMLAENMKWPALAFDKLATADDLKKYYSGQGIPCLTVIDPKGTIVVQSRTDQDAAEILRQLEQLVQKVRSSE